MKYISLVLLALFSCVPKTNSLIKVSVYSSDHGNVSIIEAPEKLSEIQSIFIAKEKVKIIYSPKWKYFVNFNPGERWLYSEDGYMQVLAMKLKPIYKIKNAERFNELLNLQN